MDADVVHSGDRPVRVRYADHSAGDFEFARFVRPRELVSCTQQVLSHEYRDSSCHALYNRRLYRCKKEIRLKLLVIGAGMMGKSAAFDMARSSGVTHVTV